jgi:hypothetical protein
MGIVVGEFVVLEIFNFRSWHWPLRSSSAATGPYIFILGRLEKLGHYTANRKAKCYPFQDKLSLNHRDEADFEPALSSANLAEANNPMAGQ